MDLTISIVNWNVEDYLKKCLLSIEKHVGALNYEVIVVDNASCDGSVAMLKEEFPQVKVIENKENVGYGSAHNQAIKIAQGEYILFLNPDTEMLPAILPRTIEFMKKYPKTAAVLCRETGDDELDNQTIVFLTKFRHFLLGACQKIHRFFPNPVTKKYIVDCIAAARLNAISGYVFGGRKLISENGFIFSRQEYLEGGFLLARMDVVGEAGGFDPKFFLGNEGLELTSRLFKRGWELYYLVNVRIIHHGAKSSQGLTDTDLNRMEEEWEKRRKVKDKQRF